MTKNYSDKIAVKYGINSALIASSIASMEEISTSYHHKKYWARCSYKAFTAQFPFMKKGAVAYAIKKLCQDGVILFGEYNESKFDRTRSYTLTDYGTELLKEDEDND